jgi:hypothetical protein
MGNLVNAQPTNHIIYWKKTQPSVYHSFTPETPIPLVVPSNKFKDLAPPPPPRPYRPTPQPFIKHGVHWGDGSRFGTTASSINATAYTPHAYSLSQSIAVGSVAGLFLALLIHFVLAKFQKR